MQGKVLVAGGMGYIGSHTCVELLKCDYEVVIVDNLSNSKLASLERIGRIAGKTPTFYQGDVLDRSFLERIFALERSFDFVINFAGLKAVGESCEKPWEYYNNNLVGMLTLADVMRKNGCKKLVFSSSATVYGDPEFVPITEDCPRGEPTNPYGKTKKMIEDILLDMAAADEEWSIILLRYFNPIGAHASGLIGEDPNGIPNNLMPYITQVASGRLLELGVFGNDYETHDGTGVRDYIHVVDLARGHVKALELMDKSGVVEAINLGTGLGYSVLDIIRTFEEVTGIAIPYRIKARRDGDIASCYASPAKAERVLRWQAQYDIADMCTDAWSWQSKNPEGYTD